MDVLLYHQVYHSGLVTALDQRILSGRARLPHLLPDATGSDAAGAPRMEAPAAA